jgi:hypothetical protein
MKDLERNKLCCLDFLTQVYIENSSSVTFTGLGTKSSPLIATATSSGGTPVGPVNSVQFNNSGVFGGKANVQINPTTGNLLIGTSVDLGAPYGLQVNGISYFFGVGTGNVAIFGTADSNPSQISILGASGVYTPFQQWGFVVDGSGNLRIDEEISGAQVAAFCPVPGSPFLHLYGPQLIDGTFTQTTGVFYSAQYTTTAKLTLVVTAGAQVYDTTLNQMSYYNGTTWINF